MNVTILSFGHKYGMPEADVVFDARCLENPYWVPELRPLSGLDAPVCEFVFAHPESRELLERAAAFLRCQLRLSERHGAAELTVAVGCTGGRHRSVAVAEALAGELRQEGCAVLVQHRDILRG
ncbi:MAG: RNase adapter RapZ [Candidatus Faecousia sp.]|uniref:RapZ C-terminal domain-containing protein n=1 Tax=Faecousia sp. TaxID=2952921 RepID=UPI002A867884|nr:RNase adapter RapZ [Candidatus Faecousia sp.]